jgi:hypothetical protein
MNQVRMISYSWLGTMAREMNSGNSGSAKLTRRDSIAAIGCSLGEDALPLGAILDQVAVRTECDVGRAPQVDVVDDQKAVRASNDPTPWRRREPRSELDVGCRRAHGRSRCSQAPATSCRSGYGRLN